jgi:hypothetical protein
MGQGQDGGMLRNDDDLMIPQGMGPQTGDQKQQPADTAAGGYDAGADAQSAAAATDAASPAGATPGQTATLVIRRQDSIWPVKMAEIATGDARRYVELNPLNPDKCTNGNWRDLWAGDEIVMPSDWAAKLIEAGYQVKGQSPQPATAIPTLDIESPQNGGSYSSDSPPHITLNVHSVPGDTVGQRGVLMFNGQVLKVSDTQGTCDANGNLRWDNELKHNKGPGSYELIISAYNQVGTSDAQTVKFTIVDDAPKKTASPDEDLLGDDGVE